MLDAGTGTGFAALAIARRVGPAGRVVCAAGLLYMPVATALSAWYRLLKDHGAVAFATMKAGSPSAGRLFRECAAEFGLILPDPSEALGTADRCLAVLDAAGFTRLQVIDARVDFERLDQTMAWKANFRAAGLFGANMLSGADQQQALRQRYLRALDDARRIDSAAAARADVLLAIGHRTASPRPFDGGH